MITYNMEKIQDKKDKTLIYNNSMWQSTPPLAPIHLDTDVAFQVDTNVCDDHIWYGKDTR